ncbi:MAG: PPC domain-containing protein [Anaerolineae bacterium]
MMVALVLLTACAPAQATPAPPAELAEYTPLPTPTTEPSPTPTPSHEDDDEPNDSMLQASGPLVSGQEYRGFISAKDDIDFSYLEIDTPQIMRLALTNLPADVDYDLYLVTGEEDVLADSSNSGQQNEHIEYTTSSVGVFYVLVLPFNNFSPDEPYALFLELSPAPTPTGEDTYEPNDTPEQAAGPLALGQELQSYIWDEGDVDVYAFQMDQPGTIQVSLTDITAVADYDLFLSNGAGEPLASSTRAIDREAIVQSLQPGTYYVTVQSFAGFSWKEPYRVRIDLVEP